MKKLTLRLPPKLYEAIQKEADSLETPMSSLIRQTLQKHLGEKTND